MKLNLELDLNQEQADALQSRVDHFNAGSGKPPLTITQWLTDNHIGDEVTRLVREQYDRAVALISEGAKSLPYDQRTSLIASIASAVGGQQ